MYRAKLDSYQEALSGGSRSAEAEVTTDSYTPVVYIVIATEENTHYNYITAVSQKNRTNIFSTFKVAIVGGGGFTDVWIFGKVIRLKCKINKFQRKNLAPTYMPTPY